MAIDSSVYQNVATAISAYARERWVHARLLSGTSLVNSNVNIDPSGEGFTGQLRWLKEFDATINIPTTSGASTDGTATDISTDIADYIKCARAFGAEAPNMADIVTQRTGLTDFTDRFVESQAKDESSAIEHVIKGVLLSEQKRGDTSGIETYEDDPDIANIGAFITLNPNDMNKVFGTGVDHKLIQTSSSGGRAVQRLLQAVNMFWKDYVPDFMYMIANPEVVADLQVLNLVDDQPVVEGNITFQTILNGKFRLMPTRTNMFVRHADNHIPTTDTKVTVIVAPGALSFVPYQVPMPVEFERSAASHQGGGLTEVWYRYGFVVHPNGYDWSGPTTSFPSDTTLALDTSWTRKNKALNLGILPIYHV